MRRGPNVVGPFGLFQTLADAVKFLLKEVIVPAGANKVIFFLAPLVGVLVAFIAWAVIPFNKGWVISDINVGILYLFAVSSLGVYGMVMAGWASNSKYAFLSALRAAAQMVSYEVSIGFVMITVLLFAGSLNVSQIVETQTTTSVFAFLHWNVFSILFPMLVIFFVSSLAETQRPPFDLLEAESELVAGFFVEYSSTALPAVLPGRIHEHHHAVRHDGDPVPGRLAAAANIGPEHLGARHRLVRAEAGLLSSS